MRAIYAGLGLCLLVVPIALAGTGLPEPTSNQELESELSIMSKVLAQSLDDSGLKDWHRTTYSTSAFEPKIQYQYLPTVGAVFTIPVNFPLTESAAPEEGPEVDESELDLWDQSARGISKKKRGGASDPSTVTTVHDISVSVAPAPQWFGANRTPTPTPAPKATLRPRKPLPSPRDFGGTTEQKEKYISELMAHTEDLAAEVEKIDEFSQWQVDQLEDRMRDLAENIDSAEDYLGDHDSEMEAPLEDLMHEIKQLHKALDEREQELSAMEREAARDATEAREASTMVLTGRGGRKGERASVSGVGSSWRGGAQKYDESKIRELRRVLIDTVAQYGHRIEHLGKDEKILLVVESPGAGLQIQMAPLDLTGAYGYGYGGYGGASIAPAAPRMSQSVTFSVKGPQGAASGKPSPLRYQIAINKSDVMKATTFDKLEGEAEEFLF